MYDPYNSGGDFLGRRQSLFPHFQQQQNRGVVMGQPMQPLEFAQPMPMQSWEQTKRNWGYGQEQQQAPTHQPPAPAPDLGTGMQQSYEQAYSTPTVGGAAQPKSGALGFLAKHGNKMDGFMKTGLKIAGA